METQKLTQEELDTIKGLQERSQPVVAEFGNIEVATINLASRKKEVVAYFEQLQEDEQKFGKELNEKYGNGTIDLEKGEFVPAPEA